MTSDSPVRSLAPAVAAGLAGVVGYALGIVASFLAGAITLPVTLSALQRPPVWQGPLLLIVPLLVAAAFVALFIWKSRSRQTPFFSPPLLALDIAAAATTARGLAAYIVFETRYRPLQGYFEQYPAEPVAHLASALHASAWLTIVFGVVLFIASLFARRFLKPAMTS